MKARAGSKLAQRLRSNILKPSKDQFRDKGIRQSRSMDIGTRNVDAGLPVSLEKPSNTDERRNKRTLVEITNSNFVHREPL